MNRLDRQSFLGPDSSNILEAMNVGFVGVGGGGSHVAQQLAHAGVGGFVPVDHDRATSTNSNRLIGMQPLDALLHRKKALMAKRLIHRINPKARVTPVVGRWEENIVKLLPCDIIVGAVDTFKARAELEGFCRSHLIPYCDLGMDVHNLGGGGYFVGGQVALSLPGDLCMRCMGLITNARLSQEASRYGQAGAAAQVVWTNGALASAAVNLIVQLFTPWPPASNSTRTGTSFAPATELAVCRARLAATSPSPRRGILCSTSGVILAGANPEERLNQLEGKNAGLKNAGT